MSTPIQQFFKEHGISEIECLVPDLTGVARGKILPRESSPRTAACGCPKHCPADRDRRVPGRRPT